MGRLRNEASFWTLAALLLVIVFASAAATPLYRVYQVELGFSPTTLTAIFAVYVFLLLATLLLFGSLSDYVGRRPLILAALGFSIAACVVFLAADSVGALFAARSLQGIATGLATSAVGAALIELQPPGSQRASLTTSAFSILGLALGALISSVLIEYAPDPAHLVWWVLLCVFVFGSITVLAVAEPGSTRSGALASLRPRVSVPRQARATFLVGIPCFVAVWALGGFYLSLGPSLVAQATGSPNALWGGLVIFLLYGIAAGTMVALRGVSSRLAMLAGCLFLLVGVAVTFVAIATTIPATLFAGTALAGIGVGLGFMGVFRMITALARPGENAALVAAIFVVAYLAFSVPALGAGVAATNVGLQRTALVYSAALAVLAASAAGILLLRPAAQPESSAQRST
jgi:predicted MFS family arabinose efflux permease